MIDLLIHLLIVCVVLGLVFWILQQIPLAEPWGRIVRVVAVVVAALIVLSMLLGLVPLASSPLHLRY